MVKNAKGYTGLEFLAIGLIAYFVGSLIVPLVKPLIPGLGGDGQKTVQKQIQTTKEVPYVNPTTGQNVKVLNPDGSTTLLMQQESSNQTLDEASTPKAPLMERIVLWFVRLGILGLVLALAFPALALTVWLWIKKRWQALKDAIAAEKVAHANTKSDVKKVVASVDNGLGVFDTAINAAHAAFNAAQASASITSDANAKAANQSIMDIQQAVASSISKVKQDFLDAMTMTQGQNSSTEALVTRAQQGTL